MKERAWYIDVKGSFHSVDDSNVARITATSRSGNVSALLLNTRTEASESKTEGNNIGFERMRSVADLQEISTDDTLAKIQFQSEGFGQVTLGIDSYSKTVDSMVHSDYGTAFFATQVHSRDALDERKRAKYSLEFEYGESMGFADTLDGVVHQQTSENVQRTCESRTSSFGGPQNRRRSLFCQDIFGVSIHLNKEVAVESASHLFMYRYEQTETESTGLRYGAIFTDRIRFSRCGDTENGLVKRPRSKC